MLESNGGILGDIGTMLPMHIVVREMNMLATWGTSIMVMHIRSLVVSFEETVIAKCLTICALVARSKSIGPWYCCWYGTVILFPFIPVMASSSGIGTLGNIVG